MHHDMGGMGMAPPPSSAGQMANGSSTGGGGGGMTNMNHPHRMMMHMTFFWSKNAEILFSGWPGYDNLGMYVLALFVVFSLAVLVEWFSHSNVIGKNTGSSLGGMIQTVMYGVRIGLAYLVMLAVMSFNAGVFIVAVAGHMLGFFLFGSRAFRKLSSPSSSPDYWKTSDLPPMSC